MIKKVSIIAVIAALGIFSVLKALGYNKTLDLQTGQAVSLNGDTTDSPIGYYRTRIMRNSRDYLNYTMLGKAYIQKARVTGDLGYFDQAETELQKALELNPKSYATLVYLGIVSSSRHDFQNVIEYAARANALRPEEGSSYGLLGDAYLELGRYEEAREAYETMLALEPGLSSYSRLSHVKDQMGDVDGAIEDMKKAIDFGIRNDLSTEDVAWAYVIVGSIYFNVGELDYAEASYNKALGYLDGYYLATEHLAEQNAARGNLSAAAKQYEKVIETNPRAEFYVALAKVYDELGREDEARGLYAEAEGIYDNYLEEGNMAHIRETALFYLDMDKSLDKALELAQRDLQLRKDIYAYDTLGWVYYKKGDYDEALRLSKEALRLGTKDARLFYHNGMINYKLKNYGMAEERLKAALLINPLFDREAVREMKNTITMAEHSNP